MLAISCAFHTGVLSCEMLNLTFIFGTNAFIALGTLQRKGENGFLVEAILLRGSGKQFTSM